MAGSDCWWEATAQSLQVAVMEIDEVLYVDAIGPRGDIYNG